MTAQIARIAHNACPQPQAWQGIQPVPTSWWTTARAKKLGGLVGALCVMPFSPSLHLLKWTLNSYLPLDETLSHGVSLPALLRLHHALHALDPAVVLWRIFPLLLGCLLFSLLLMTACTWLGQTLAGRWYEASTRRANALA